MNLTYAELVKGNRNFRNLLAGQIVSEMGNWFNFIAGLGVVRLVSDASPQAAGILFLCRLLPFAIFSPIAGTFVDRFSRRQVMIWSDLIRVIVALAFLFVTSADNLWIAYIATVALSMFGAFFDGAKNATTPNLTGKKGLLAGTALMFSSRFLLMAVGSALGGWASAAFGYKVAFVINAVSFAVSAYTVWLIPEEATSENYELKITNYELATAAGELAPSDVLQTAKDEERKTKDEQQKSFIAELKEGFYYTTTHHFALTILIMNVIWATGGGAVNIVFERLGGIYFAAKANWQPDLAVALLWTAAGLGLTFGMLIAHRTESVLERRKSHNAFIFWTLLIHGILFAVGGYMPNLWLLAFFVFISRAIIGVEYAVQETMFQRSLPDYIRGRISTLDRGAEMTIFGLSGYFAGEAMYYISPQALTLISGLLSASAGIVWRIRQKAVQS